MSALWHEWGWYLNVNSDVLKIPSFQFSLRYSLLGIGILMYLRGEPMTEYTNIDLIKCKTNLLGSAGLRDFIKILLSLGYGR
jgi:hypothetical protein